MYENLIEHFMGILNSLYELIYIIDSAILFYDLYSGLGGRRAGGNGRINPKERL